MTQKLEDLIVRLEKVTQKLESSSSASVSTGTNKDHSGTTSETSAAAVKAFDEILSGPVHNLVESCSNIGSAELKELVFHDFSLYNSLILTAFFLFS